ncbi:dirigent protein 4-like [Malania oleifera]|uniref:dirigent protein 4-like n=1 Tax=Malania oleifera TaxID=397392 RepID=UPI0025AE49EE|nr:dirigent protein 4-like [Malania oleifera]
MEGKMVIAYMWVWVLMGLLNPTPTVRAYFVEEDYTAADYTKTNRQFFVQDTLSGKNPSAVRVAGTASQSKSSTNPIPFGTVFAIDDPLTDTADPNSNVIGNVRGLYLSSSQNSSDPTLVMYLDFALDEFSGSSFSVFSRNPVSENPRELAVTGGRGKFRMGKGFAWVQTFKRDPSTFDAVLQYNVTVYAPVQK